MPSLILVRHSAPEIEPAVPPRLWRLSEDGRAKCAPLAERLAVHHPEVISASAEPKVAETAKIVADILGRPLETAEGLSEHNRRNVPFLSNERFDAAVAKFFREPQRLVFGLETADQAHSRFAGAVDQIVADHPGKAVVVVTHGTVITLFVSRAAALDPLPVWKRLGIPSYVVLSLPERRILEVVDRI